jgi:5,10-methylenetetrahydrofolate reductase
MGVEAVPTLTCRDCRRDEVSGVSESRKGSLENVLVVYGDPFPGESRGVYEFKKSEQLIRGLSQESSRTGVSVGAITNQYAQNRDGEVSRTLRKVEAGAEFVLTNISFEADGVLGYRDELLSAGLDVPLLFQVSIPHSRNNLLFVSQHFGIPLSRRVRRRLDHGSPEAGVALAADAFEDLHREANGVHFSYLRRTRNPVPAYCALLDRLEIHAQPLIVPLEPAKPLAR